METIGIVSTRECSKQKNYHITGGIAEISVNIKDMKMHGW